MILIADSGSTKTDWSIVDSDNVQHLTTPGINPFFQSQLEIETLLRRDILPHINGNKLEAIYFYGAGCSFDLQKQLLVSIFSHLLIFDSIEVESDLLGAARSLCGQKKGIACILGTGSNSCYYDGTKIDIQVSPLGFILGDEGSGASLGKQLVSDCLKNQLPADIIGKFFKRFDLTPAIILDAVYKKPFPNRFLASLSIFLKENLDKPEIHRIVTASFTAFFKRNIFQYPYQEEEINITGSIGFHYREILDQVADSLGIKLGIISQSPMSQLIIYHQNR